MKAEPQEVRIARIEEGLVAIHGKMDSNQKAVMEVIKPLASESRALHDWMIKRNRDGWWIVGIAGTLFGVTLALIESGHWIMHQ